MKKYILRLIDNEIAEQKKFLQSAEQILMSHPNDAYWLRRKKFLLRLNTEIKF